MTDTRTMRDASCLDDQTIAAYADGKIDPARRMQVEAHLATCEDCYELLAEVLRHEEAVNPVAAIDEPPVPARSSLWGHRGMIAAGSIVAIAAALVMLVINARSPMAPLVNAVGAERLTAARPTGGFAYGPLRSRTRGSAPSDRNVALLAEAAQLQRRASSSNAPKDQHAWGVAQMLSGDLPGSIATLDGARKAAPTIAAYEADYGAALLTRFLEERRADDGERALAALDRATTLDPGMREAWFNKALLFEALGKVSEAANAWNTYLGIDGSSEWSSEARRRRDALGKQ
jgi:hypothetical protein